MNRTYYALLFMSIITSLNTYGAEEGAERKVAIEEDSSAPASTPSASLAAVEEEKKTLPFHKIFEFKRPVQEEGYLIRPSPTGNLIMSVGYNHDDKKHYVRIHEIKNKSNVVLDSYDHEVHDAAWSPNSAFVSILHNGNVSTLEVKNPSSKSSPPIKTPYVYTLIYNACSMNETTRCIRISQAAEDCVLQDAGVGVLKLPSFYIVQSCCSNESQFVSIYTPATQTVCIYNLDGIKLSKRINITAADFSGPELIIGYSNGVVEILSKNDGKNVKSFAAFKGHAISGVALAPDLIAAVSDTIINIISRSQSKSIASHTHTQPHNPDLVRFNASGKFLAYSAGRTVNILDANAHLLQKITLDGKVHDIFFGNKLIAATSQSIVALGCTQQKNKKNNKE